MRKENGFKGLRKELNPKPANQRWKRNRLGMNWKPLKMSEERRFQNHLKLRLKLVLRRRMRTWRNKRIQARSN
jgi:hypothetical protein